MLPIRPTRPEDQPALEALLHAVWGQQQNAVAYHGAGERPGFVVEVESQLVGYSHSWHSRLHPTFTYMGVHVHPAWRGQGIGNALWQAAIQDQAGPLKAKTYASQHAGTRFLRSRGLSLSVETHEPTLETSAVTTEQVGVWTAEAVALGFDLLPMSALTIAEGAALVDLHDHVYAQAHCHDPSVLGLLGPGAFLGEDLVSAWLFVARKERELVGVASIRREQPDPVLGWFGVTKAFTTMGIPLTLALTGLSIQAAAREGVTQLGAELDDADVNAVALLRTLPWQAGQVWQTFTSASDQVSELL